MLGPAIYFFATSSTGLGFWTTIWLAMGGGIAKDAFARRRGAPSRWVTSVPWSSLGLMVLASGQIAVAVARDAHWRAGPLHMVMLVSYGTNAAFVVCMGIALVTWLRWVQRQRRA